MKFIKKKLSKKVKYFFLKKKNSPTIIKKRFVDHINKNKILGVYEINDELIDLKQQKSITLSLEKLKKSIDHIIVSDEIFPDFISSNVQTFKVDNYFDGGWSSYDYYISDHRPVFMKIDNDTVISGDMNSDGSIDVLDVVSIVSIILSGGFDSIADTNYDGVVNVIDVVILVNYILDTDITQNNFIIR